MSIKIEIPFYMRKVTNGREIIELNGNTVGECIADFIRQFPDAKDWFDPQNPIVWIVLNQTIVNFDQMDKKLKEGDNLSLVMVIGAG